MSQAKLKFPLNEKAVFLFCILLIMMFNSPNFILKDNFYPPFGYDSLDSYLIWNKLLVESGKVLSGNSTIIYPAMGGLPRVCYPSEFSIELWLSALFKPYLAYAFNILLIQLIAFWGMALLLKKISSEEYILLVYLVSLLYSCLKFWPHAGIGVAGLPLLIYSYLMVRTKLLPSILVVVLFPLYSNIILTGIFLLGILFIDQITKMVKQHFNKEQFLFVCSLALGYFFANYRLFLEIVQPTFVSHRSDFVLPALGIKESLHALKNMVFYEYGHSAKRPIIIVLIAVIYFLYCFLKKIRISSTAARIVYGIIILSGLSALLQSKIIYGFYSKISFLKPIQLQRFYWILPPLFYMLFFVVLREISTIFKKKMVVFSILIFQFIYIAANNTNWRQIAKTEIFGLKAGVINFHQFYSSELYVEIKQYIGKDQRSYRVASLGLQPAAALYNGFYTIDGYFGNYPKNYKDSFYQIIKKELNKNEEMKKFFLNWGSVCIILSDEMIKKINRKGYIIPTFLKNSINEINELSIDTDAMRRLDCQYLFSAFKILNCSKIGLHFENYFENTKSPYGIYLYSI